MKTFLLFVLSLLLVASLPCIAAINYSITFTGTGASTTVGDVIVQNLTKGTTVTVPAGNVLNLSDVLSAVEQLGANDETIRVYPNSAGGAYTLSFYAKQAGSTQVNVYGLDGRKVISLNQNLQAGSNSFQLSLSGGSYAIQVIGNEYTYSAKMINQNASMTKPEIVYVSTEKPMSATLQKSKSAAPGTTTMTYITGDRLLYQGTSGNYCTIVTDVPTEGKNINFDFIACTDGEGNNYKIVKIGTQTWMAENLKTTKYRDGTSIPNVTDNRTWDLSTPAYCWYDNDATTNKNTYGAMYNWYAVKTAKLAPIGWHVPTDAEWTILDNYLLVNGYNYDGTTTGNEYAKSLAATTNWTTSPYTGVIGGDLSKNNSTGFSALPGGYRISYGPDWPYSTFFTLGSYGHWWTATEDQSGSAWTRKMGYESRSVNRQSFSENMGYSVRCLKD